ncbi:hypothetical protein ACFWVF_28980 [Streptomyces sp. NPDC058659]|uniref:hypothetical protein n=1 Tax=Streptomyces sp. NPDC058659 TaxID=3346581 RepID=UPI00365C33A0
MPPHLHIAERCIHGDTKRHLCDHRLLWSRYRVREVPCLPSFCETARRAQAAQSPDR